MWDSNFYIRGTISSVGVGVSGFGRDWPIGEGNIGVRGSQLANRRRFAHRHKPCARAGPYAAADHDFGCLTGSTFLLAILDKFARHSTNKFDAGFLALLWTLGSRYRLFMSFDSDTSLMMALY
jgi:hypothetical protein